jgi:ribosomal-protein-alanine N-acetyltransferase
MIETGRLVLRELTPGDAEALFRVYHEPGVLRYFVHGPPESVEVERGKIERHLAGHWGRHGFGLWATCWRETGEVIGRCGLLAQEVEGVGEVEVAYLLSPRFWGRGLGSEAARAVRDYGFGVLGRERLVSLIHRENEASKRVARAVGMGVEKVVTMYGMEVEVFAMGRGGWGG